MTEYEFHPLADQYPLMSDADLQAMADDISEHGQLSPVVLLDGKILDGRNRYLACRLVGFDAMVENLPDGADPVAWVESANEHRRHLTPSFVAQRRAERIARVAEKRKEGKSLRVIAEEEGVSLGQVQRDVEDSGVSGDTPEPPDGKVTGKDGKKQAAKKPRKPEPWDEETVSETPISSPQRERGEDDEEIPAKAGDVLLDGLGLPVPKESREAFETAAVEFAAVMKLHRQLSEAIDRLANATGGMWVAVSCCRTTGEGDKRKYRSDKLHNLAHDLKAARPYTSRCPYCHNEGHVRNHKKCEACRGLPYVTKDLWDRAPGDYCDALLKDMGGQS